MQHPLIAPLQDDITNIISNRNVDAWKKYLTVWMEIRYHLSSHIKESLRQHLLKLAEENKPNSTQPYTTYFTLQYNTYMLQHLLCSREINKLPENAPKHIENNPVHTAIREQLSRPYSLYSFPAVTAQSNYRDACNAINNFQLYPYYHLVACQHILQHLQPTDPLPDMARVGGYSGEIYQHAFQSRNKRLIATTLLINAIYLFDNASAYAQLAVLFAESHESYDETLRKFGDKLPSHLKGFKSNSTYLLPGLLAIMALNEQNLSDEDKRSAISILINFVRYHHQRFTLFLTLGDKSHPRAARALVNFLCSCGLFGGFSQLRKSEQISKLTQLLTPQKKRPLSPTAEREQSASKRGPGQPGQADGAQLDSFLASLIPIDLDLDLDLVDPAFGGNPGDFYHMLGPALDTHRIHEEVIATPHPQGYRKELIAPDGNCLFSAIAAQLHHLHSDKLTRQRAQYNPMTPMALRQIAANEVKNSPHLPFFLENNETLAQYQHRIVRPGEWGGELEINAITQALGINIRVCRPSDDGFTWTEYNPDAVLTRPVCLIYNGTSHYDMLIQNY
tara:strand:- start:52546 stop:54231 length:1686 start_codon:yes stop_codon:yes gene_type:complete